MQLWVPKKATLAFNHNASVVLQEVRQYLLQYHCRRGAHRLLPGLWLCDLRGDVRPALHAGDGVLRPDGAQVAGAQLGIGRGPAGAPGGPPHQAEISEDDYHRAGDFPALLPALPPG